MAKYENIRALAKKQLQAVTESSDRWKAFLRTAAIAYNYSFPNQLLIHEQSPTATAVADIAYWNNNAGRWVKRGAHGIAVFDTRANSSRLRYLFDISDTIPRAEVPDALPWVITDQNWRPVWDKIVADNHADSIQSALLMLSTSCVAQRSAMFTTALGKAIDGSSLQWAKPDEQRQLFIQLITQSCLYMAALRCGVDTARLDLSALESVNQFDTNRITLCLGSACQQAARPLMQQIGSITREIDSVARAEKVRYYGDKQEETNNTKEVNNGVHDGERLPNPGADAERAADAGDRQVRQPAAEIPARERADGVRRDAAGGNALPASGGDGQRSTPANRADDADADAAEHRPEPADRPDGLDAVDERLAEPSRGTGDAADLQPVIQEPQAESDTTPSAFSVPISDLPPLSDELILGLLAKESSSRTDNAAILEYFNEHPDLAERSAFCKHCYKQIYPNAVKLFHATKDWLKERLGLDISPEKSKVISLKEDYSDFLGFRLKVIPRGKTKQGQTKFVVESHVREKSIKKIKDNLAELTHAIQYPKNAAHSEYEEIAKYNAFVLGVHDYYSMATKVSKDFRGLAFSVQKSQKTRFRQRLKTAAEVEKNRIPCHIANVIKERYGKSKQLRYVGGIALAPIGYVKHRHPIQRKRGVNSYTAEGRAMIHKQLEAVDMEILHYLMRNPVWNATIEYNDNRLSLYSAQMGKCAVTGAKLMIGDIFCHHKVPRCNGGTDAYQNLILLCGNAHRLIHATDTDTIARLTDSLNLTPKQKTKVDKLRSLVHVESC